MEFNRGGEHQVHSRFGGIKRLKPGAPEQSSINDRLAQQYPEPGRGVYPATPQAAAEGVEVFRVLAHQQGFGLAVTMLLFQVIRNRRAPIMPHERRWAEPDLVA